MTRPLDSELRLSEAHDEFLIYLRLSKSPCPECRAKAEEARVNHGLLVREAEDLEEWGR